MTSVFDAFLHWAATVSYADLAAYTTALAVGVATVTARVLLRSVRGGS